MELDNIVPWGRSLTEYQAMFNLTATDLSVTILGCSDGPASFNAEVTQQGGEITSVDPVYQFSAQQIEQRIQEVYPQVLAQTAQHRNNFNWQHISSPEALAKIRMQAMQQFLSDYPSGKQAGRYQQQSLPTLHFADQQFDLALCSHYLFLYSDHLSLEHHINSLMELSRVAKQVRVYPLITLTNEPSPYLDKCIAALNEAGLQTDLIPTQYEFQRGATEMLVISQAI